MERIVKTASEELARIEKECFKRVNLKKASLLKGEERRKFILKYVGIMLKVTPQRRACVLWLSDQFWTAEEGRVPMYPDSPLMTEEGLRPEAALLANMIATRLGIANKWKLFEKLWHRNNMRSDYNTALNQRKSLEFQAKLKKIIG